MILIALTDAALLAAGIAAQRVFASETRRERALLVWIHDGVRRPEEVLHYNPHAWDIISLRRISRQLGKRTANDLREEK